MRKTQPLTWEQYRRRMLEETARFIEWGLKHPELTMEIPAKRASDGGFAPGVGEWFWTVALSTRLDATLKRWRDFFIRKPKEFPGRRAP